MFQGQWAISVAFWVEHSLQVQKVGGSNSGNGSNQRLKNNWHLLFSWFVFTI